VGCAADPSNANALTAAASGTGSSTTASAILRPGLRTVTSSFVVAACPTISTCAVTSSITTFVLPDAKL